MMGIASGEVRINGTRVFINDTEVAGLRPMPPVPHVRRQAPISQNDASGGVPSGKGAQGRLDRSRYWTKDGGRARAAEYNAKYHGRMARNSHGRLVPEYTDCGRFVHEVVQNDDPNFPAVSTHLMKPYIEENWKHGAIGEGGGPEPGDVLIVNNSHHGHVGVYGGPAPGGGYTVYNASLGGHGPKETTYKSLNFFEIWGRPK